MIKKPPKKRVIVLGDTRVMQQTDTFALDVYAFGVNDIHDMIVRLTERDTKEQIDAGNAPTSLIVDGSKNKPLNTVEKKATVLFAEAIPIAVLMGLKSTLISNIRSSTTARTGALSSANNWEFRLIRNGKSVPMPSGSVILQQRDYIVLMPRLGYASAVNMRVAGGSKSFNYRPTNASGKSSPAKVAKRNQKLGFMAMTARMARTLPGFAQLSVIVLNTKRFAVPGERRRYGTAFLRVSQRSRMARR